MAPPSIDSSTKVAENIESMPNHSKQDVIAEARSSDAMSKGAGIIQLKPPTFTDLSEQRAYFKAHMAAAFRYLAGEGYGKEGVAGHISVRDPILPDHFWLNPFAKHFSMMKVSDLVLVNHHGEPVAGQGGKVAPVNAAAFAIHSAIHEARPDVTAACHAHSIHGKAFATLGIELDITTQDSCIFWKDHALYADFGGVVFQAEEGRNIARALGQKKALILQNHGLLTTGSSVDEAVFLFGAMDRLCHAQMLADAAAAGRGIKTKWVGEKEAEYTWKQIGGHDASWFQFQPEFERIAFTQPDTFE